MNRALQRMKNIFTRNRGVQQLPPGSYPIASGDGQTLGTITKPVYPTDDDDDDEDGDEDIESLRNYNVSEQTRLRGQPRDTIRPDYTTQNRNANGNSATLLSGTLNTSSIPVRGPSSGFVPGMTTNPDVPSRPGLPFLSQIQDPSSRSSNPTSVSTSNPQSSFGGFPPGMNPNESRTVAPSNPQSSLGGFPPGMNPNQATASAPSNPQSSFGGFPPGMNPNQTQVPTNNAQPPLDRGSPGMNANQTSPPSAAAIPQPPPAGFPPGMNSQISPAISNIPTKDSNNQMTIPRGILTKPTSSSFRNQSNDDADNVSRLELDYPIENVLIDANVPAAVAIKINDAVEQDRLGNAYHIHRYTFEPPQPQKISYNNNQHSGRHLYKNSYRGGTRHIREIQNDNQNSLLDDMIYPRRSHKSSRRRPPPPPPHYFDTPLNQYIDQLLHTPGSIIIQPQNSNDLQQILHQHLSNPQIIPTQLSMNPFQSNTNPFSEPIFYYTARALYNDPMRSY